MATQRIEVYKDGVLVDVEEVEVPDPAPEVDPDVQQLLEDLNNVTTVSAKVNALTRYFERIAGLTSGNA